MRRDDMVNTAVLGVVLCLAMGCSGTQAGDEERSPQLQVVTDVPQKTLADLIRVTGPHFDYVPEKTPSDLLGDVELAVEGKIASVEDGRIQAAEPGVGSLYQVVVGIEISTILKEDPRRSGELVYFELRRPDNLGIAVYRDRLVLGTPVTLFAYRAGSVPPVANEYSGRENGSSLYVPAPQGLFLDDVSLGVHSVLESTAEMPLAWRSLDSLRELRNAALR